MASRALGEERKGARLPTLRVLFILDQLPSPPRNGVTIPTYNILKGLSASHEVSLLFIPRGTPGERQLLDENRALVHELVVMEAPKAGKIERMWNEVLGKSMFHMGRRYPVDALQDFLGHERFDVIWVSDDGLLDIIEPLREVVGPRPLVVAGINDAITGVFRGALRQVALNGLKPADRLRFFLKWLRSFRIPTIERRLLEHYDLIPVQSEADRRTLSRISKGSLDAKSFVLTNGVEQRLFEIEQAEPDPPELLFVGSLVGYGPLLEWLLDEVWLPLLRRYPELWFTVVGPGASPQLKKKMQDMAHVRHHEFLPDVCDIYRNRTIAVLPVRKSWGVMNKVIEAMAAGLPVVGDRGSFNAIPGFSDGVHGIVAAGANDMIGKISMLLDSGRQRLRLSEEGRKLIASEFDWNTKIDYLEQNVQRALYAKKTA